MRKIKVIYRKLGREKVWGLADNEIELDIRLRGKKHLEILLHEATHVLQPELTEEQVEKISIALTNTLWAEHYRRIDNDNKIEMQDGRK